MKKTLERLQQAARQLEDAKQQTEETVNAIISERHVNQERERLRVLDTSESQREAPSKKRAAGDHSSRKKR